MPDVTAHGRLGVAGAAAILRNFALLEPLPFEETEPLGRGVEVGAGGVGLDTRWLSSGAEVGMAEGIGAGPAGTGTN